MVRHTMLLATALLASPLLAQETAQTTAQHLVDLTLAAHPDITVVAMHVTPPQQKDNIIFASNIGRIGKKADADDLNVVNNGKTNLEVTGPGDHFAVELRLLDASHKRLGALSLMYPYKAGDDKAMLARRAENVRDQLSRQIPNLAELVQPYQGSTTPPVAAADPNPTATLVGRSTNWHPGYSGDLDHFGVDVRGNRLFLAAEDHGSVELFNLKTSQHERTLDGIGIQIPHAFVYLPKHNRLIIVDGGSSGPKILDTTNYKIVSHIKLTAPGADSVEYDASTGHLYIVTGGHDMNMKDCFLNDVDPLTGHVYATLRFDSNQTQAVKAEQHGNRLFVNVADHSYVAVVDKKTLKVIARWPINGARTNLTMALDEADHRLFVGSRNPSKLFVLNTDTGATVAMLDAPATSDGLFWDSARRRVYVPGGDGYLGVFQQVTPDLYAARPRIASAIGAKSGIVVPQLDRLYLAVSPGANCKGGEILWFGLGK